MFRVPFENRIKRKDFYSVRLPVVLIDFQLVKSQYLCQNYSSSAGRTSAFVTKVAKIAERKIERRESLMKRMFCLFVSMKKIISGRESKSKTKKRLMINEENSSRFSAEETNSKTEENFRRKVDRTKSRSRSRPEKVQIEEEGKDFAVRKVVRSQKRSGRNSPSDENSFLLNFELDEEIRIDDLTSLTSRNPISTIHLNEFSKKATEILRGPTENDKFSAPKAIAVTETNQLLIADTKKHRIVVFDLNSKTMRGIKGFLFPDGLCLGGGKFLIVTDRHRVSKYDWINGRMISSIGSKKEGSSRSSFSWPKGVAIDNQSIFVCDSYNSRIVVLNHQMRYETEWIVLRGSKEKFSRQKENFVFF